MLNQCISLVGCPTTNFTCHFLLSSASIQMLFSFFPASVSHRRLVGSQAINLSEVSSSPIIHSQYKLVAKISLTHSNN